MSTVLTLPEQRVHVEMLTLRIGSLHAERPDFDNYPNYQRERVWSYPMKRSLIDTILHDLPIPPLFAVRKDHRLEIADGQQRLTTILEFLADGFATARLREDPALGLIEPNKRFSHLSADAQATFNGYTLYIWVIDERDEACLGVLFRRLQQQQPLSLGERLWAYREETRAQAGLLLEHPFWKEIYIGKVTRKRTFLGSLYMLLLELDLYPSITTPRLRDVVTGMRDGALSPSQIKVIQDRLTMMGSLFAGTMIESLSEIIPLYQAAMLVEKSDYDPRRSEKGCLTPWYASIKEASRQAHRMPGTPDPLARITTSKHQIEFWNTECSQMLASRGLFKINKKRCFSHADRMEAFNRQHGICPVCLQPVKPTDEGHHVIHYKNGGPTTPENCVIIHTECHTRLHEITGSEPEIVPVEDIAS